MTTILTTAQTQVIDYLNNFNPDGHILSSTEKLQLADGLKTVLCNLSVESQGSVLLLYSGALGPDGTPNATSIVEDAFATQYQGQVRTVGQTVISANWNPS